MATEAVANLGLLSSMDIFLQDGERFIKKLNSLHSMFPSTLTSQTLKPFEKVRKSLKRTVSGLEELRRVGKFWMQIGAERRKSATNVIDLCTQQLSLLTMCLQIMTKAPWRHKKQVVLWFGKDKGILSSLETLGDKTKDLVQLLAFSNHRKPDSAGGKLAEPCTMVPFVRNLDFVGRENIMDTMQSKFQTSCPVVVLTGPAGIG